jgi:hypothetical protein
VYSGVLFVGACLIVLGELLERHLTDSPGEVSPCGDVLGALLCVGAELFEVSDHPLQRAQCGPFDSSFVGRSSSSSWGSDAADVNRRNQPRDLNELPGGARPTLVQGLLAVVAVSFFLMGASVWRGYFLADVSHNVAIFFLQTNGLESAVRNLTRR